MTYEEAYKKIESHFDGEEFQTIVVDAPKGKKAIVARNVPEGQPFWEDGDSVVTATISYDKSLKHGE